MTYGEQRCNYHLQVYLFYRQRKKKTSSILLKSSVRCRKPGPGVRHALWTEVVKKILKIDRSFLETYGSAFLLVRPVPSVSRRFPLAKFQKAPPNRELEPPPGGREARAKG